MNMIDKTQAKKIFEAWNPSAEQKLQQYIKLFPEQYEKFAESDRAKIRGLNENDLLKIPDVSEGLENRIIKHLYMCESFSDLLEKVKTKRYTMARIRRILLCAAFGITNEFLKKEPPYIHVLGCTKKGEELIKEI